ncbi:ImmA/IrrE family metallo-endopeptidase [Actinomycetospora straminea]|uniref:ImmA/IrrE family metallo-endopeptidase n=1 Tax=Actinomycetospora straminea TaxID=663607 RepID=A0ABP9F3F4_9PSEU|nr:ImmA/IrrE family metallo-endopeptidase [Actinomycetospora straminea]MDD7936150.1 ImmA/IrrE family metallo-endopeptidase [Actinomycetospora straminea]
MAPRAETVAEQLLLEHGLLAAPVDLERLAEACGVEVVPQRFEDGDVSGMLLREEGMPAVIGVNTVQAAVRQRFTIAHELGHWALHPGRLVIFDRPMRINRRDSVSAMATDREEIQANAFAAALLMPERLVRQHVSELTPARRRDPEDAAKVLASIFRVSAAAMNFRLINLGLAS